MRKNLFFAGFFLLAIVAASAQSKGEKDIANAIEKLKQAMIDGNKADLENAVADQLSYGHSSGVVQNKKEFVEKIVSGQSDFVTIDLTGQTINIIGDVAIVRHKLDAKTNDNGKPGEAHLLVLLVFQKDHKHWKLLARQAVKAP
jgi:hypothetical protein